MSVSRAIGLLALLVLSLSVKAFDPLFVGQETVRGVRGAVLPGQMPCSDGAVPQPLQLQDAIDRSLCGNPKSQEAWANIKVQSAALGISRAAYLPSISATSQYVRDNARTDVRDHPELSSNTRTNVASNSISLSWVLYDFGGRSAALKSADELLAVAEANQDSVLQTLLSTVAQDYYSAQAAEQIVLTTKEIEATAADNVKAASLRVSKGVAPITDELQARTTLAEDVYEHSKAAGDFQKALGTLASDINLAPYASIQLPESGKGVQLDPTFTTSVVDMINEAVKVHPDIQAARAQVEAAQAKKDQVASEGMPTFGLTAKYSTSDQPASLGLGAPEFPATGRDWYVGAQVTIPLFEGFGRVYKVHQAQAQIEYQEDTLDEKVQKVSLDVWLAYHDLQSASQKVKDTDMVADIALKSYEAAHHRYVSGVGNILELLNSQTSLATAKKHQISANTDWRIARLQLAFKLGELGTWWASR